MSLPDRRRFLHLAIGAGLCGTAAAASLQWRERVLVGFGTRLWLRAGHASGARAERALDAAVATLRDIESQMSLFDPASALCRLNRDGVLDAPGRELLDVLRLARDVARRSDGAFDATVQPLWQLWQRAAQAGRRPGEAELAQARAGVGWRGVDLSERRIALRPGMALTLNGIAQGHAADRARDVLVAHGIEHALVDAGEWMPLGQGPQQAPWRLGIADPHDAARLVATLRTDGRAVATSSGAQLVFTADGREHHLLDPRTGHSPHELASVTVVAPRAALADALTKVVYIAGWEAALATAQRFGADALVVHRDGRWRASAGLVLG